MPPSQAGDIAIARMLALPLQPPQPPDNTLSAADQRVRGKRASAKCSASTQPWPPLYKHGLWDTGGGIKRSVSAVGLCTQTQRLKGLMFRLCPQGGHWGWERVLEGRTCSVCVSALSQRRSRAGDGRMRLAAGKGTVPQLPSLQRRGLGMADNAVVLEGCRELPGSVVALRRAGEPHLLLEMRAKERNCSTSGFEKSAWSSGRSH